MKQYPVKKITGLTLGDMLDKCYILGCYWWPKTLNTEASDNVNEGEWLYCIYCKQVHHLQILLLHILVLYNEFINKMWEIEVEGQ